MSKLKDSQINSFNPAMSKAEAEARLPDLHEDASKDGEKEMDAHAARLDFSEEETSNFHKKYTANITEEIKKDEAIAHQKKVIEAFDTQQQIQVDKKIAKAGYDKASETGGIAKSRVRRGVEALGSTMAASADLVTGTIQRGDKGAIAKDLSKMSTKHWEKQYKAVNEDKDMSEKDKANFNLRVEESNKQAALEEEARVDQTIANEGFDEASVERKLAKQEKGGLLKRIGRWFGRN